jgi:hypothetical protein
MKTLLALSLLWMGSLMAASPPPDEPAVVLPAVTVNADRELRPRESWQYLTLPGFEILSSTSSGNARKLLQDFQLFREALAQVWPRPTPPVRPTLLLLCGASGNYDAFLPPAAKADPNRAAASVFVHDRLRSAIVLDCASRTTGIISDQGKDDILVEARRELYRQYVHLLMSRSEPPAPAWFVEGFAQIAKAMELDRHRIVFGKLQEPDLVSAVKENSALRGKAELAALGGRTTDRAVAPPSSPGGWGDPFAEIDFGVENKGFLDLLKGKPLMPLAQFFAVQEDSTDVMASLGPAAVWPQQAYAFVHFCLFGGRGKYQKPLARFLQRLNHEAATESLFQDCFKLSYEQMLTQIHGYQDTADYSYLQYRARGEGLPLAAEPAGREATPAEFGRIKGTVLELAGHSALAHEYLLAPYLRHESDGPLLAALGLWEHRHGNHDRARQLLESAFAGATPLPPEACIELARYRSAAAIAQPAAANGKLASAQVDDIVAPLLRAHGQPPPLAATYELLAETWQRAEERPAVERVELLIRGAQLYPARFELILNTALLCDAVGLTGPARALAEHGLKFAPDAAARASFAELVGRLP